MKAFVLDLWVLVLPISLLLVFVFAGMVFVFQFPVPQEFGPWFGFTLAGNLMQLGILATLWYRRCARRDRDDSCVFWGEVLKRHWFMGGALYYLYYVRGWLLRGTDRDSYRRTFWIRFVHSSVTHVIRVINRVWIRIFIVELLMGAVAGVLRVDTVIEVLFRIVGVTVIIGMLATLYLEFVLVRDAAIRWEGSPEERSVAIKIFSRFYWYRAAEVYFQAALALESTRGK